MQVQAALNNLSMDASSSFVPEEPRARPKIHADYDAGSLLPLGDDRADALEPSRRTLCNDVHIRLERDALLLAQVFLPAA